MTARKLRFPCSLKVVARFVSFPLFHTFNIMFIKIIIIRIFAIQSNIRLIMCPDGISDDY